MQIPRENNNLRFRLAASLLGSFMRVNDQHHTTAQENVVFFRVCRLLQSIGFNGEVHKNPVIYIEGKLHRPDIYIPALGLIIEVDGRIHEKDSHQQKIDAERDEVYRFDVGLWLEVIPNWRAHNSYQLTLLLLPLLQDRIKKPPPRTSYIWTAKAISAGRKDYVAHVLKGTAFKKGSAGKSHGFKLHHWFGGFKIVIRPKKQKLEITMDDISDLNNEC